MIQGRARRQQQERRGEQGGPGEPMVVHSTGKVAPARARQKGRGKSRSALRDPKLFCLPGAWRCPTAWRRLP